MENGIAYMLEFMSFIHTSTPVIEFFTTLTHVLILESDAQI